MADEPTPKPEAQEPARSPGSGTTPPPLWTNPMTLAGLLMVAAGILLMLAFWLLEATSASFRNNQYIGAVGFMILPGVLVNGLILCPLGIVLRKRKLRRGPIKAISARRAILFVAVTFLVVMPILGVAAYKGYHFTESAEFCGTICHNMDPQYRRYSESPHARVTCAGCHIGPGASPFVKSKLSGLRQVYRTAANTYPRPIPPAITELRPARDTCEQCHWPSHFHGSRLRKIPHYAPDERNTSHTYDVLIKVGGLSNHLGQAEGIHMHMLDRVEYISEDQHRLEKIQWVRYKRPDGGLSVYRSDGKSADDPPPPGKLRTLDCIDCHNLSGHDFVSPEKAVNHALSVGQIDATLPYIKREAARVLVQETASGPEGMDTALRAFYEKNYPQVMAERRAAVEQAVRSVRSIHDSQMFPEMKTDWRTYPSHIGHMESPGCFRCHDEQHVAADGKRISSDCNSCHTFLYNQGEGRIIERSFDHPMKIHHEWEGLGPHARMLCSDCHDGGLGALGWRNPGSTYACGDCHSSGRWKTMTSRLGPPATKPIKPRAAP